MVTSVRTQPPVIMPGMQTEIKTQATNLAANLSAVRESATATLSGEIKGQQLEDFPALIKQASLDALFKCGKDAEALKEVFTNSNNVAGKKAIMEFAGLFRSALNATSDSPEAKTLLMKVGAEYTAQIIKDGLKEKSAFGPWLPETKKAEAKLENLEKQLLDIIKNNTGGELSKLSTNLVMQEVMPYIASCIEHNFGCTLDPLTRSSLTQLVDKAAAKAVEALDMCHQKLTQEQGTSVGREARHLEMQTLIPLLLRNVFAQIPADKLPDPKIPEPAAGPVPDGGKKAEPTGINININIDSSNHSVDNSKHINNSRSHVDNSQRHIDNSNHDNSRKTIDNSRTFIDNSQRHGESHHSTNSSNVSHSHSRVDSTTHQTETGQTAEIVNVKPLASQLAGVENVKIDTLQSDSTVITGNKAGTTDNDNSQTDKTGPFSGLKFKQNSFLSTVPSVTNMHSIHFNAREAFLGVIRKALEPDASTPFPVRRAFDGLRGEILPNDTIKSAALKAQCSDIDKHPELKAKMETLKEVITHHPQKEKLAEIALQFAREAGLTRQKGETDYVLSNVLDGLIGDGSWRAGPAYESYLNKPGVDRVITTVDGLHMQR